jgi:hypothetical protein
MTYEDAKLEYERLINSDIYAYSMGHGSSMGDHPLFQQTRDRADRLRAIIREYEC